MMEKSYGKKFQVVITTPARVPRAKHLQVSACGHLNGCRIGFDLGASDYKVSAVADGEVVFTEEMPWDPKSQPNPGYHYHHLSAALHRAAAHLPRVDAIGGSSAGATIQGDYLCRGGVFTNFDIMYDGYEHGLGFLRGVAIDQHFAQRKRFADMTKVVAAYPQLLGIGLDESTAIIVRGHAAEVVGKHKVHFYDRTKPVAEGEPDHTSVEAGQTYDLKARRAE